jgi:hypothetical protein
MGKLVYFTFGHPSRHRSAVPSDRDAIADGLKEFGDLFVRPFITEADGLGEVMLPIKLYSAVEGLEPSFKGGVILRTRQLEECCVIGRGLCVTECCTEAEHQG